MARDLEDPRSTTHLLVRFGCKGQPPKNGKIRRLPLFDDLLDRVQPGELWIGDRNFSTRAAIATIVDPKTLRKHPRKPKPKKGYAPRASVQRHVATARVLADGGMRR